HRVVALLEKGMSIGQVRRALGRPGRAEDAHASPDARLWSRLQERMLTAVIRFDEEGLDEVYNEALALLPVEQVTQRLLLALEAELVHRVQSAEGSVAEARFFGVYFRNKLGARMHHH